MELEGKIWKQGKFWLVEIPSLDVMTQGKTRKEALFMVEDAIFELVQCYFDKKLKVKVFDHGKEMIGITSEDTNLLLAFSLRRQREKSGSTIREAAKRLGSKSPNAYSQYEKGSISVSVDKYEDLLLAANPKPPIQLVLRSI